MAKLNIDVEVDDFSAWSRRFAASFDDDVQPQVLRALGLEFLARVIPKTPVDTGRARGGWLAYADAELPIGGEGLARGRGGLGGAATGGGSPTTDGLSEGRADSSYKLAKTMLTITNGVPYILPLEFGHSKQFPAPVRWAMREMLASRGLDMELIDIVTKADRLAGVA